MVIVVEHFLEYFFEAQRLMKPTSKKAIVKMIKVILPVRGLEGGGFVFCVCVFGISNVFFGFMHCVVKIKVILLVRGLERGGKCVTGQLPSWIATGALQNSPSILFILISII